MPHDRQITRQMRDCIQECLDCHAICVETIAHCLGLGGEHASPDHIALLEDCAQICQTSADFMLRGSERHTETCRVCADICERCAQDCERMARGDETMTRCAEVCRRCAESCSSIAGALVH
ncbi:MAG: four-helix bundle copper-binding protein [Acidobacteria bacterium]|nr:four-helix bundle copper-binding protein [Acidobacteriota bacterium]